MEPQEPEDNVWYCNVYKPDLIQDLKDWHGFYVDPNEENNMWTNCDIYIEGVYWIKNTVIQSKIIKAILGKE